MTLTFAEQYEVYKNNVTKGMLEHFAEELGVTVESLETLGVGYYPGEYAWVFAERDAGGDVVASGKAAAILKLSGIHYYKE